MKITIPSRENQLIELENDRLKLQIDRELWSSSADQVSFEDYRNWRAQCLYASAEQGRLKELPPEVWLLILLEAPRTAIYCPCFSEFSALDWVELLKRHPQLAEFCEDFTLFLCDQITSIILSQPKLLCCFPAESVDWIALLQQDAETFAPLCPNWCFSAEEWGTLLAASPQLREYCDFKAWDASAWSIVLQSAPHLFQECPCVSEWGTLQWNELLAKQPQLAAYCRCWKNLSITEWAELLSVQPRLISYCPKTRPPAMLVGFLISSPESEDCIKDWSCFSLYDWLLMLRRCRELEPYCHCWERFPVSYWWNLLFHQPDYIERCPVINQFSEEDWQLLCRKHPLLKKYRS